MIVFRNPLPIKNERCSDLLWSDSEIYTAGARWRNIGVIWA